MAPKNPKRSTLWLKINCNYLSYSNSCTVALNYAYCVCCRPAPLAGREVPLLLFNYKNQNRSIIVQNVLQEKKETSYAVAGDMIR